MTLAELLSLNVFAFMLIFCRVGLAFMTLPGFGDSFINVRVRLLMALGFTLVMTPVLQPLLPAARLTGPVDLLLIMAPELLIGLFIGMVARTLLAMLSLTGIVMSHSMAFANTMIFNPTLSAQSTIITSFLTLTAVVMIFASDLHHMLLGGIVESYRTIPVGGFLDSAGMSRSLIELISVSFTAGLQIAAPFLIVSMAIFLGMGILARLVPQIQVFFLAMPVQIMVGMVLFATTIAAMMLFFLQTFEDAFMTLFVG